MDYTVITTIEDFAAVKEDWKRLEQSTDVTFFSTFDYCYTWWKIYQNMLEYKLWIIVVQHNGKVVGIAPLLIERRTIKFGFHIDVLKFLADGDYHDFLIDLSSGIRPDKILKLLFDGIESNFNLWNLLNLSHISHKSLLTNFIFKSKYNKYFSYLIENPYVKLDSYKSFDDFKNKQVPAKAKQYAKRLTKIIEYEFVYNDVSIDDCRNVHIKEKKWLHERGFLNRHSLFENNQKYDFMKALEDSSMITSFALKSKKNSNIIIYNWGYVKGDIFHSVNTAYDPEFEKYGLGRIMYFEMFKYAFESRIFSILDAGTGRYPWKFEWTSDFNLLYQLQYRKPRSKILKLLYRFKS